MADLIEIGIEVRTNSVKSASREIDSLGNTLKSAERSASAFVDAFARQERQISKASQANRRFADTAQGMYREILQVNRETKSATDSARVFEAEMRKQEAATKAVANSYRQLKASVDPAFAAQQRMKKAHADIRAALAAEIITRDEAAQSLRQYRAAAQSASVYTAQTARNTNQLGVLMQQTGYQVGDFAVQVQSGTNVMVALGQQATQLVGTFGMLAKSTRMIGVFAGLGILIPIVTGVAGAFMRMRENAEEALTNVEGHIKSLKEETQNLKDANDLLLSSYENLSRLRVNQEREKIVAQIAAKEQEIRGILNSQASGRNRAAKIQRDQLASLEAESKELQEILDAYDEQIKRQESAQELIDSFKDTLDSLSLDNILSQFDTLNVKIGAAVFGSGTLMGRLSRGFDAAVAAAETAARGQQVGRGRSAGRGGPTAEELRENVPGVQLAYAPTISTRAGTSGRGGGGVSELEKLEQAYETLRASVDKTFASQLKFEKAQDTLNKALKAGIISGKEYDKVLEMIRKEYGLVEKGARTVSDVVAEAFEEAYVTTEEFNDLLKNELVQGIESVSGAFTDFIMSGLRNFSDFADAIKATFRNLIATLIQTAVQNQIIIPIATQMTGGGGIAGGGSGGGIGGGGAIGGVGGGLTAALTTGGSLVGVTGLAGGFGAGLGMAGSAFAGGGFSGLATTITSQVGAATTAGASMASIGAAAGAIAAPLLAIAGGVALISGFFKKKTTQVDQGLDIAIEETDALVETFQILRRKSRFGKSSYSYPTQEAPPEVANPIIESINEIQTSIVDAAGTLGIASSAFDGFTYDMRISLKGLSEEEAAQKLTESLSEMADEFVALTGIFENMDQLLAVANQRYELQTRLLQLQGNQEELLSRQREQELAAVHPLNRALLERIHLLEDVARAESMVNGAMQSFASGIMAQQNAIRSAVAALVEPLQEAINRVRDQARDSLQAFRSVANETRREAEDIVRILRRTIESRTIQSESVQRLRYTQAQQQLSSFAGGEEFTESQLRRATEGVSIDTTGFFGSFEDYARDFYKTQISLTKLADKAEGELTDVEKQIDIAEKAYQVALGTYQETQDFNGTLNQLLTDLESYTQTVARNEPFIEQIKEEGDRQVELLDSILAQTIVQFNALRGVETSVADLVGTNVTISEALGVLGIEGETLAGAVVALEPKVDEIGSHIDELNDNAAAFDQSTVDLLEYADGLNLGVIGLKGNIDILDENVKIQQETLRDVGINIFNLGETLSDAMGSLGGIVSGLSSSVSNLVSANNALATAQKAANVTPDVEKVLKESKDVIEGSKNTSVEKLLTRAEVDAAIQKANEAGANIITSAGLEARTGKTDFSQAELERALEAAESFIREANTAAAIEELQDAVTASSTTKASKSQVSQKLLDAVTPGFAMGGMHSGGLRMVGEEGPELEVTGPSRIYNKRDTMNMLSSGGSETVSEIRNLRREVSELRREQRKIGVENVKYNKKSYDLNRQWDIVGLPETRTT